MQPEDHTPDPESQEPSAPGPDPIAEDPADAADSGGSAGADVSAEEPASASADSGPAPIAEDDEAVSGGEDVDESAAGDVERGDPSESVSGAADEPGGLSAVAGGADPQTSRQTARPHAIHPVEFSQIDDEGIRGQNSLDLLMDVKLPISVELGRADAFIKDILEYGPGTVVELNKMAGDPVDILVNGRLIAQGEVVVVDDHFGVRLTALLSPKDRLRSLA